MEDGGKLSDKSTTYSTWIVKFNILKIHEEISDAKCALRKMSVEMILMVRQNIARWTTLIILNYPKRFNSQNPCAEICLPTVVPFPIGLVKGWSSSWSFVFNHRIPTLQFSLTTFLQAVFAPVNLGFPGNSSSLKCIFQAWNAGICTL